MQTLVCRSQYAAAVIKAAAFGKKAPAPYKPHGAVMFLTLGPADGAGQAPFGVVGGKMVGMAKGKELMSGKFWGVLKAKKPALPKS